MSIKKSDAGRDVNHHHIPLLPPAPLGPPLDLNLDLDLDLDLDLSMLDRSLALKDEDKLYRYKGVLYPTIMCPESNFKALENFKAREDDIVLAAYPKSGNNWVTAIVRKIIKQATGMDTDSRIPPLMEIFGPDFIKVVDDVPSPRFLGTHLNAEIIPSSFAAKKTKILVVVRNPKDTCVSYYHFANNNPMMPTPKSWDSFYTNFMSGDVTLGSYFDHALTWDKRMDDPNVMVVTFEELKEDLSDGIRRISTFFGFSLTEAQVQQITEESTFKAMKENLSNAHALAGAIYRKGEVGDWKNHFTQEQSKEMDQVFNKRLAGTRLGAKLNYQKYCQ